MNKEGNAINYITKVLGLACEERAKSRLSLPLYLKGRFDCGAVGIEGTDFLLLMPRKDVQMTVAVICTSAEGIRKATGLRTIIVLDGVDAETRRMLISKKENFVVPQKQLYVPELGMLFQERGLLNGNEKETENLSPAAQRVVLYHLQVQSLNGLPLSKIAELLGYPAKTITQVVKELENKDLCEVTNQTSRSKGLVFTEEGKALWDKGYPYMQDPIKTVVYVDDIEALAAIETFETYDRALAHYTFIADSGQKALAVYWRLEQIKSVDFKKHDGAFRVELWKYPPIATVGTKMIDPLSLALCFKDDIDERVDAELQKLIDKILA